MTSLNSVISGKQFKRIMSCLRFAREYHKPPFRDPFREFRVLQESFNSHMEISFNPSWLTTLDESMNPHEQPRGCPGHVIVGRKFMPEGNEIHTHACALSKVIFWMEILEGKDAQPQIIPEFSEVNDKTTGLMLRGCKFIFGIGRVFGFDSCFPSIPGLLELKKRGVFGHCVLKKRKYWPSC